MRTGASFQHRYTADMTTLDKLIATQVAMSNMLFTIHGCVMYWIR